MQMSTEARSRKTGPDRRLAQLSWGRGGGIKYALYNDGSLREVSYRLLWGLLHQGLLLRGLLLRWLLLWGLLLWGVAALGVAALGVAALGVGALGVAVQLWFTVSSSWYHLYSITRYHPNPAGQQDLHSGGTIYPSSLSEPDYQKCTSPFEKNHVKP